MNFEKKSAHAAWYDLWTLMSDFKQGRELPFIWPFLSLPIEINLESVLKQASQNLESKNSKIKPFHPCGRTPWRSKNFERHLANEKKVLASMIGLSGVILWWLRETQEEPGSHCSFNKREHPLVTVLNSKILQCKVIDCVIKGKTCKWKVATVYMRSADSIMMSIWRNRS
jgi:hypothetical protein